MDNALRNHGEGLAMDRNMNGIRLGSKLVRTGLFAALTTIVLGLAGCKNVSKTDYDAAVNENAELRSRVQALESERNAKDTQLAGLRDTASQPVDNSYGSNVPSTGSTFTPQSNDQDFRYNNNGSMVAEIAGDVLFASGQATIKSDAKAKLDRIARTLNGKYSGSSIRIEGHTDTDPINKSKNRWSSNQQLSEARAEAVKSYLSQKGVASNRVMTTGLGATQPKSSKAASRRVEIIVMAN